jgi:hypothetical protein
MHVLKFRYMDLDPEVCQQAPFNSVDMVSATDYAAALTVPKLFSWQRAARTFLVKSGMQYLLPVTDFLRGLKGPDDPLFFLGGSSKAYNMLQDTLSPLHLYACGAQLLQGQAQFFTPVRMQ